MKRKSPQEKKQLDYEKAHFSLSEYPHAFRIGWPRKKAAFNQKYRRQADQLLSKVTIEPAEMIEHEVESKGLTRERFRKAISKKRIKKWGVVTLSERVDKALSTRASRIGWNYFKEPYETKKHRHKFIRFLESNVLNARGMAKRYAAFFGRVFDQEDLAYRARYIWLKCFFKDEPEWETKLKKWIEKVSQEPACSEDA